jgi:signal transduction histidine kinase
VAFKLRDRILGWSIASTLVIVASVLLLVDSFFNKTIRATTEESLVSGARLAGELHRSRVESWITDVARTAVEPTLRASLETGDPRTIGELLDTARANVGADWLAVATPDGDILAQAGPVPADRVGAARDLIEGTKYYDYGDLWVEGDSLVEVGASSVNFGAVRLGVLFGGRNIDRARADEVATNTGDQVAFLAGGRVAAADSAVDGEGRDVGGVDWSGGPPGTVLRADDPMSLGPVRDFRIGNEEYLGTALSLHAADRTRVGSLVVFRSLDAALAPVRGLRFALVGIGIAGIILGLVMSLALSQSVTSPVNRLLGDTVRLGSGNLEEPVIALSDDEIGQLAVGVDRMRVSLREAREEVIRRERLSAVGRAASALVHDFAQPVTVISAHTEFLALGGNEEERKQELNSIREGVRRIQTMMREVLEFAKGEVRIEKTATNVGSLLHEVATQSKPVAQSAGVKLLVVPGYEGDWMLDYHRTSRALGNLVRNAAAAMSPTGGGTIKLRSLRENGSLRLEVEDDGPGIPDEIRHSLFEPFVSRGKREGTGLGLAIVKNIAESQGGRVAIDTSSGHTVFAMELPEATHPEVGR